MYPVTGYPLKKIQHGFAVSPEIHEEGVEADLMGGDSNPKGVAVYPFKLSDHNADILGSRRNLNV
jgi:hypothetical protein